MKIKVKLFAALRTNRDQEQILDFSQTATPKDVLEQLNIPPEEAAILFVNGRSVKLNQPLEENDVLSIFPPVGGG